MGREAIGVATVPPVPTTARELLADAEARLAAAGVPTPRVDAELLLAHVTNRPRALVRMGGDVPGEQVATFEELVTRRASRIPLQHLTGSAPFRRLELAVGPGVFVPRPETELLVDEVLTALSAGPRDAAGRMPIVVDLCTGSAAIALAIATEAPGTHLVAIERSADALHWARCNVAAQADALTGARATLDLIEADATTCAEPGGPLADLAGGVDVVVTNPPYVPDEAVPREPEVREHDPALALYGGPDGLDVVRGLARQAAILLRPGGLFAVEHADVQGEEAGRHGVPGLLREQVLGTVAGEEAAHERSAVWRDVRDHLDLAGRPRFTTAIRVDSSPRERTQVGGQGEGG